MDTCRQPRVLRFRIALGILFAICSLSASAVTASAQAATPGQINILRNATSSFDSYTVGATSAQQQWMRDHYWRMRGYAPYFDRALSWAPPTDFYRDLYAIYQDETTLLSQHPNWVLKDSSGQKLYIPWACNGTSCTQYAADIGNPAFRQFWINEAKGDMAKGYKGIFVDDVNLEMKVGNASGTFTRPIDPRTGQAMTDADWRKYMAEFAEEIRSQIPGAYIVHNTAWWMDQNDPYVRREVSAASAIELERGFNDSGLTGGTGKYAFRNLLAYVDWLHTLGKSVVLEPRLSTSSQRQFELASYYLVSNGSDAICTDYETNPDNWWAGWETNLGASRGPRYEWRGLLRRDFEGGFVLVNLPGATTTTVSLEGSFTDPDGRTVNSVTLGARQGQVLLGQVTTPPSEPVAPAPVETESGTKTESGTQTGSTQVSGTVQSTEESGTVQSSTPTRVSVKVKRRAGKRWMLARTATVRTNRRGKFRRRFLSLAVGEYRVTARSAAGRTVLNRKRFVVR